MRNVTDSVPHGHMMDYSYDEGRTRAVDCLLERGWRLRRCLLEFYWNARYRVAHSGLVGVFSLVGYLFFPMAFVTTTLALVVHSPICMRAW